MGCGTATSPVGDALRAVDGLGQGNLETPPGIAHLYSVSNEDGVVTLRDRPSYRLFEGGLLAVLGGMWPVLFVMLQPGSLYAIFALAGCLAFAVGVKTAVTQVTYTLSPGRILRKQSSPFGITETDLSQARLQMLRSGSQSKLYLLGPGESFGPFAPVFLSLTGGQTREQVATWMVAITGLRSLKSV